MPGDRPKSGDKPSPDRDTAQKGEALKSPQKVSPTGGGTGPYQGGNQPTRHEGSYPGNDTADGGTDDRDLASTHQEDRPELPDKDSAGGASQLDRGTSLASKSTG